MVEYGFIKETGFKVDELETFVTEELKKEGFGIVSRVDMKSKFNEKLGKDFKEYIILGACKPDIAFQAVNLEENIGLLLPCNVVVYETVKGANVGIIKPSVAMVSVNNRELLPLARAVEDTLKAIIERI